MLVLFNRLINNIKGRNIMAKFHIEVPHESDETLCKRAIQIFLQSGSHFLTNAEWGCLDGDHKAWIIAEADSREEARGILPPAYRHRAKIVQITRFTAKDLSEQHQ
jgi:hypothetical protein